MGQADASAQQQRALALKAANPHLSFRDIETETGVPKSTIARLWKAASN